MKNIENTLQPLRQSNKGEPIRFNQLKCLH